METQVDVVVLVNVEALVDVVAQVDVMAQVDVVAQVDVMAQVDVLAQLVGATGFLFYFCWICLYFNLVLLLPVPVFY
jgi:hypothetical protein